jgi:DNA-directed RNA polymerase subunit F
MKKEEVDELANKLRRIFTDEEAEDLLKIFPERKDEIIAIYSKKNQDVV